MDYVSTKINTKKSHSTIPDRPDRRRLTASGKPLGCHRRRGMVVEWDRPGEGEEGGGDDRVRQGRGAPTQPWS